MELTAEERRMVQPYLSMRVTGGKGWLVGIVLGLLICVAAFCLRLSGIWPEARVAFLPVLVTGMVVIEMSIDHRQKTRLAGILQKLIRS
jgi:hypothetical protein